MKLLAPLPWLAAFEAAARHSSFTQAAQELGITQGAVSIQIQRLESTLESPLFVRKARSIELTEIGETYLRRVRGALTSIRHATEELFEHDHHQNLSISCYSPSFADLWLAPRLPALYADFPNIEVTVTVDYQLASPQSAQSDIHFTYEDPAHAGSDFVALVAERLVAVMPSDKQGGLPIDWSKLPLIETAGPRASWRAWFEAAEMVPPETRIIKVNSMQNALAFACAGSGVALAARPFIDPFLENNMVTALRPDIEISVQSHGLYKSGLANRSYFVKRIAQWFFEKAGMSHINVL